jgi:transglutaminase-like putative cysteine protease
MKNRPKIRRLALLWSLLGALLITAPAAAQFTDEKPTEGIGFGESSVRTYRIGVRIHASGGSIKAIRATLPIPIDWPEQTVRMIDEDISRNVRRVSERKLGATVSQMTVEIPRLSAGEKAHAFRTYEVTRRAILAPDDTTQFKIPAKSGRELKIYLGTSPYIETLHPRIRKLGREVFDQDGDQADWEKVEAIYDHVREIVSYKFDKKIKGAYQALRDGVGDCEELSALFIALCRVNKIPARLVWVPDHCYAEFYLEDAEGQGHWFPCELAGTRNFGQMPQPRPILQKGDNFKVPEKKERQLYVSEHLRGLPASPGGGKPKVSWVRELLE